MNAKILFAAIGVAMVASATSLPARAIETMPTVTQDALAQAEKPKAATRVKEWTRTKVEAAKKRMAENKAKFSDCQVELDLELKTKCMGQKI